MSWDIYVQDLPPGISHVSEIPDDFVPRRLGTRTSIIAAISEVEPNADFSEPQLGKIEGPGYSIDVSLGNDEVVKSFAFHVYGGGEAPRVIVAILQRLGFRALDPGSETGLLDVEASRSFETWQQYRDRATSGDATPDSA